MKKISSFLTNRIAPSAGFSEGQYKDDPGDSTGSGALAQTPNDFYYGFLALIKKYIGGVSDTDESENASDMRDAIENAIGIKNENVSEYVNTTTYAQDDHVMYLGLQFVSMINSNTGNAPLDNPDKWFPCMERNEVVRAWRDAVNLSGGFAALHDKRDATNYRLLFEAGKYNFGGDSGESGVNKQATALHLDGTTVTGNTTLENLLDVGGANEYHLLDVIAPDVLGTRTLLDSRGRTDRVVDNSGGDTENVGVIQDDAMQRFTGTIRAWGSTIPWSTFFNGVFTRSASGTGIFRPASSTTPETNDNLIFNNANSTFPNAAKTDDDETRMKNYTVGVPYIIILNDIP